MIIRTDSGMKSAKDLSKDKMRPSENDKLAQFAKKPTIQARQPLNHTRRQRVHQCQGWERPLQDKKDNCLEEQVAQ